MNRRRTRGDRPERLRDRVRHRAGQDYLIATSEHPLTAMRMDEVIEPSELPIKMVGVSPTFQRRSVRTTSRTGASGGSPVHQGRADGDLRPRGLMGHHEDLLTNAVDMWDSLGLHYRVVNICTGDMGTVVRSTTSRPLARCGRVQGGRPLQLHGLPGQQAQDEVQDVGGELGGAHPELHRHRDQRGAGGDHEQNQLEDGTVTVPEVLRPYMGGKSKLEPVVRVSDCPSEILNPSANYDEFFLVAETVFPRFDSKDFPTS